MARDFGNRKEVGMTKAADGAGKTGKGPNRFPEARTEVEAAAVATTCRFLGRIFYEGDTICYQGSEWRCSQGNWAGPGRKC